MKKVILIGLMVMLFAMPCVAQTEIEPDALSLYFTRWESWSRDYPYTFDFQIFTALVCRGNCSIIPCLIIDNPIIVPFAGGNMSGLFITGYASPLTGTGQVWMSDYEAGYGYLTLPITIK